MKSPLYLAFTLKTAGIAVRTDTLCAISKLSLFPIWVLNSQKVPSEINILTNKVRSPTVRYFLYVFADLQHPQAQVYVHGDP